MRKEQEKDLYELASAEKSSKKIEKDPLLLTSQQRAAAAYYLRNIVRLRAKATAVYRADPDLAKAKCKEWYKLNQEIVIGKKKLYYANKIKNKSESELAAWRKISNEKSKAWHVKHPRVKTGRPLSYNVKPKVGKTPKAKPMMIRPKKELKPLFMEPFLDDLPSYSKPYFRQGVKAIMAKWEELKSIKI